MLDCWSTNATVAKIRAIHGHMFTKDNYHEMLSRRSVPEIAEYLAQTKRFKEAFTGLDPSSVHRAMLEEILHKENFNTYKRLCRFQGLDKLPFFDFLVKRIETDSILSMINSINSKLKNSYLQELPGYVVKHSKLGLLELSKAESFEELVSMLKGTDYGKVLAKLKCGEDGTVSYTDCELALRNSYYDKLLETVKKNYHGNEGHELAEMIHREIDSRNIINTYRMKIFFGYSVEDIKKHQLKHGHLGSKRMNMLFECDSKDDIIDWTDKTAYLRHSKDTEYIEAKIQNARYKYLSHEIHASVSAPVVMYAFIQLCETEVSDVVHIIEAVRYGADTAEIESKLIVC